MKKVVVLAALLLSGSAFASYQSWAGGAPKRTALPVTASVVEAEPEAPGVITRPGGRHRAPSTEAGEGATTQGNITAI
ncbi:hypothetical protein [Deinococcus multiflagellatus]|uniref:Uncharacterized protein n=1 Tax=Deinococcus multiflagellatus TaxID=1656887 RepID=A0ABW1ZGS5_9DEIO|nr:hypothetical protein [Deinococcus multiflagellatus]MBZ9713034.1 hypothetical protein [Deinococcus multiflagellatus]